MNNCLQLVIPALQVDTESATKWFTNNFIQANPDKFHYLLINPTTSIDIIPEHIVIDNTQIKRDDCMKYLGITVDDKLKFDIHVVQASNQLNVLYRFKNIFSIQEKKTLYQTFIISNFNYCPIV